MFRKILARANAATVIATFAFFLALSGGAMAASHYLITSTRQLSPKVIKALRGQSGKTGERGATGPQGPVGPTGPQGSVGTAGTNGTNGTNGTPGAPGAPGESPTVKSVPKENANCPEGGTEVKEGSHSAAFACNGSVAPATLPEGRSESGAWSADFAPSTGEEHGEAAISFTIPLAAALPGGQIHVVSVEEQLSQHGKKAPASCAGTAATPTAEAGWLCIYEGEVSGEAGSEKPAVEFEFKPGVVEGGANEAGVSGVVLFISFPQGVNTEGGFVNGGDRKSVV